MILIYTDIDHLAVHAHAESAHERRLLGLFVRRHPVSSYKREHLIRVGKVITITASLADINAFSPDRRKKLPKRNRNYQGEGLAS
jgi:hypothetical protein